MKFNGSAIYSPLFAAGLTALAMSVSINTMAVPEVHQNEAVSFVSGGVGEEERQEIMNLARAYPLEFLFAARGSPNEYLADVKVQIRDMDGRIIMETISQGPFLLVKVPPGRYFVRADYEGTIKQQSVRVTGGHPQRTVFIW